MMKALSHEEFMMKVREDLRKKKKDYMFNDADRHILDNNLRIQKAGYRYDNRRVNCGRH